MMAASAWLNDHIDSYCCRLKIKFGGNGRCFPINTTTNLDDTYVKFDDSMQMFVPNSIGVAGVENDVGAVAAAADSICEMDFIVEDTYDRQDDIVFLLEMVAASKEDDVLCLTVHEAEEVLCSLANEEDGVLGLHHGLQISSMQGETTPKKYLLPDLNLPSTGDILHTTEVKVDRDFDLNKLPIRGMYASKDDSFYEESFIQLLHIFVHDFY